jgi:predicted nucleotide-binding protein (sugar kinase/HSP70/actin superfamily)
MRVGVPRTLDFFRFHPSWAAFFEPFDVELVVSPPTTRATLEEGQRYAVPESCLPLKLYYGHVRALVGQVDALLVPSFHRVTAESANCAKLIGLPDLLRAAMPDLPPLIAPDIDLSQGSRSLFAMVLELGTMLTHNPLALRDAAFAAWAAYLRTRAAMREGALTPAGFDGQGDLELPPGDPVVAVLGHPYNLYDSFVNHNLLARLARMGVSVLVPERLGPLPAADYWTFEYELVGAAYLALAREEVAGIVVAIPFGCGPDGVMVETVRLLAAEGGVPLLALTLDEHAGEAGLVTRIEAFVDMLGWKRTGRGEHLSRN